jgi:hypothetical protein
MRETFSEACSKFPDGGIDLLHIDGLHTYDAVKADFEQWFPKISPGGVVMLHDITVRRDDFGVFKLWAEIRDLGPSLTFGHSNGLGVLQLGMDGQSRGLNPDNELDVEELVSAFSVLGSYMLDICNSALVHEEQVATLSTQLQEVLQSKSWRFSSLFRKVWSMLEVMSERKPRAS